MNDKPTLLIVDDTPANRKLLSDLLSAHGYATLTAENGEEALALLARHSADLVLLDVVMPGLSGYDVCRRIRADPAHVVLPVVMVTALDPAAERIKGIEAGADDFLTKPINRAELMARVKSLLRIKQYHDTVQRQAAELAALNSGLEQRVQEQVGQLERLGQLKRFFSPPLAERIVSGDLDDPLATRRREITVAFLDLRGFTGFADTSEPEEVMGLLRTYHGEMGRLIDAFQGTLEQLTPDTMMVVFNDPVLVQDPAARAVRMALDMQRRFGELMAAWIRRGHDIALSIGIAHGYATIGTIGYETRIGYGVVGRVTNLAARLCSVAQRGQILASTAVAELVAGEIDVEDVGQVDLKGFARPVSAVSVLGVRSGSEVPAADIPAHPLRIFTLGQFSVLCNGQPLALSRKVQKRPLDLIKLLVAEGGVGVEIRALMQWLWPDADGDAAQASFDSTLYRLRKLIGVEGALTLSEGRLSLDGSKCWVDVWALDALLDSMEGADADIGTHARDLLRLYPGHFLDKDSQEPWAVGARDRIKARFVRAVSHLGAKLEVDKRWSEAIALYARALELDNLAESLYRRLMICHRENGEAAEALNVYRRCRDMLSIVLGTRPAADTEAIRGTLG